MSSEAITRNDLLEILNELLPIPKEREYSYVTNADLWNNWVAPNDGIVNAVVGWTQQSYGYMYIKDYTSDKNVCMISNPNSLGGFLESSSFPVIKGHVYKVLMSNQVSSLDATFYSL